MNLLLYENLSWRLVNFLKPHFSNVVHVSQADLAQPAKDIIIWNYAKENDYCIVTNDDDFSLLSMSLGFPPKVILLRTGNQSSRYIGAILLKHKEEIAELLSKSEYGVLEIY